jgi:hypothetical protein
MVRNGNRKTGKVKKEFTLTSGVAGESLQPVVIVRVTDDDFDAMVDADQAIALGVGLILAAVNADRDARDFAYLIGTAGMPPPDAKLIVDKINRSRPALTWRK